MKGSLTDSEFIDLCTKVALFRGNCELKKINY